MSSAAVAPDCWQAAGGFLLFPCDSESVCPCVAVAWPPPLILDSCLKHANNKHSWVCALRIVPSDSLVSSMHVVHLFFSWRCSAHSVQHLRTYPAATFLRLPCC